MLSAVMTTITTASQPKFYSFPNKNVCLIWYSSLQIISPLTSRETVQTWKTLRMQFASGIIKQKLKSLL